MTVALSARFAGLSCGPFGGDERYVVLHSLKFGTGDLNPHFFDWPASPFFYMTFVCYGFLYVGGRVAGVYSGPQGFSLEYFADPGVFYFIPRLESAFFGLATVALLGATARRLSGSRLVGLLSGLFLLTTPVHILISRRGLADTPLSFFLVATLWYSLKIAKAERVTSVDYAAAGIAIGLATAMKYSGMIGAIFVFSAHLYRNASSFRSSTLRDALFDRRLWIAGASSLATFLLVTPYALLDRHRFLADLKFQIANQNPRFFHRGIVDRGFPFVALLGTIMPDAMGIALWILGLAGLVVLFFQRRRLAIVAVLVVPALLAYLIALERSTILGPHYVAPAAPLLCILAALVVVKAVGLVSNEPRRKTAMAVLTVAAIVTPPLHTKLVEARRAQIPDTYAAAMNWVRANLPPGTKLVTDDSMFNLIPTSESVERNLANAKAEGYDGRKEYWESLKPLVAQDRRNPHYDLDFINTPETLARGLDGLRENRVEYYLLSQDVMEKATISAAAPPSARRLKIYRDLQAQCRLVTQFRATGTALKGPTIKIYRIPLAD